jgi:hypothetical protein
MNVTISEKRVLITLMVIAFYLAVQSVAAKAYEFSLPVNGSTPFIYHSIVFVNVNFEYNLPSWYSTLLIASAATLVALTAYAHHSKQDHFRWRWTWLSVIFFYLSLDEATALHERFTEPLRTALNTERFLYFAWGIVGALFVLVIGALYVRFLLALPKQTRNRVLIAALTYVGGALFVDGISALWYLDANSVFFYNVLGAAEEFCEMSGMSIFIFALLGYLRSYAGEVRFSFTSNSG